jgi:hypothetical protein
VAPPSATRTYPPGRRHSQPGSPLSPPGLAGCVPAAARSSGCAQPHTGARSSSPAPAGADPGGSANACTASGCEVRGASVCPHTRRVSSLLPSPCLASCLTAGPLPRAPARDPPLAAARLPLCKSAFARAVNRRRRNCGAQRRQMGHRAVCEPAFRAALLGRWSAVLRHPAPLDPAASCRSPSPRSAPDRTAPRRCARLALARPLWRPSRSPSRSADGPSPGAHEARAQAVEHLAAEREPGARRNSPCHDVIHLLPNNLRFITARS